MRIISFLAVLLFASHAASAQTTSIFDVVAVTGSFTMLGTSTFRAPLEISNASITLTGSNGAIVASSAIYSSTFSALPGSGNDVMLRASDSSATGGIITLQAGHGVGAGGRLDLRAGNNSSSGAGGDVNLFGGRGANVGGDVYFEGGTQTGSFGLGGDVILVGGNAGGFGALGGRIFLIPGLDFGGGYRPVTIIDNAALFLSGSAGNIILESSVAASGFFGSSALLTQSLGIAGSTFTVNAGRVGISTGNPSLQLDVNGDAQFGSGAAKSTFTANPGGSTYALQLSSGITVSNGGPLNLTSGGFIRFADGTTATTAASGGGGVWSLVSSSAPTGGHVGGDFL